MFSIVDVSSTQRIEVHVIVFLEEAKTTAGQLPYAPAQQAQRDMRVSHNTPRRPSRPVECSNRHLAAMLHSQAPHSMATQWPPSMWALGGVTLELRLHEIQLFGVCIAEATQHFYRL